MKYFAPLVALLLSGCFLPDVPAYFGGTSGSPAPDDDDAADDDDAVDPDGDEDGHPASVDCDDADPSVHPGAPELCDGLDTDCDPNTFAPGPVLDEEVDGDGDEYLNCDDCDDEDDHSYPGAPELCDGKDNDCDGAADAPAAGPAASSYTRSEVDYQPLPLSSGAEVLLADGAAAVTRQFQDFDFDFFGAAVPEDAWTFHRHGVVEFTSAPSLGIEPAQRLPDPGVPNALVAWWWQAIANFGGGEVMRVELLGAGRSKILVLQIDGAVPDAEGAAEVNLQVQFREADDSVEIHFAQAHDVPDEMPVTIGLERADGEVAVTFANAIHGFVAETVAVRFTPATAGEVDDDGDLALSCDDCDDLDAMRSPGGSETCDGIDEDCDGVTDDGVEVCLVGCTMSNFDGASYMACPGPVEWSEAVTACEGVEGYTLTSIHREPENQHVYEALEQLSALPAWIGATDTDAEGTWQWVDGTPLDAYTNWDGNWAGGAAFDCALIGQLETPEGEWVDADCTSNKAFICKAPAPPTL